MKLVSALAMLAGLLATTAHADPQDEVMGWLQRMTTAAKKLNYTGTFTYQSGGGTETSRIIHLVDAAGEHEKLEVLDGSPREVIRSNDEVKCYLPEDKVVIIEKRSQHKAFPALLPVSVGNLGESYLIRKGETARIAGFDSQQVVLEPKDTLRYGHQFWADIQSGLILKARTLNERNETIEQFAFSQLQINPPIDKDELKPHSNTEGKTWRIHNARASQSLTAGGDWHFRTQLPGFKKGAGMKRQGWRGSGVDTTHFIFSDGLASISVLIEPRTDQEAVTSTYSAGAINVYKRTAGKHLLTVLGEVPMTTLMRLGDGIEPRKK